MLIHFLCFEHNIKIHKNKILAWSRAIRVDYCGVKRIFSTILKEHALDGFKVYFLKGILYEKY